MFAALFVPGDRGLRQTPEHPSEVVAVLAAFAHAVTSASISIPGDIADAFTAAFSGTVTADVTALLGCTEADAHAQDDEPGERHSRSCVRSADQ
ncbi:hypothetical protein [Streptomyces sp. NPDC058739]|uniref:hypothetical protein n=1 Tax=Streptomyces sp. NPDC058739 TaxID=3346618 RepID=UPI0036C31EA1